MAFNHIAFLLGLALAALGALGVWARTACGKWLIAFPRHRKWAIALAIVNTAWAAWWIQQLPLGRFAWVQPWVWWLAIGVCWLTVRYMDELLAPRMLGGLLLLLAVPILNATRWHPSPWRLIVPVLVYVWVVWGMWLMLSPYRFRHTVEWFQAAPWRHRCCCGSAMGVGGAIVLLALFVY